MKACTKCQVKKALASFALDKRQKMGRRPRCKRCESTMRRQTGEGRHARCCESYGITAAIYAEMLAKQGGGCAICGNTCKTGRRLAIDHNHETGQVRGLLCSKCNRGLGMFDDRQDLLRRSVGYLQGGIPFVRQ